MPLGFQSHTKPLDFENHLNGFPGRNILPPMPPSASAAGGLCRTETSLLVGERAFPATLGRGRGKAQLGLCSDPLPLVLSCHAPGSEESSVGAACMLSSGQGCTCLLTSWVNNSVSPVVQMGGQCVLVLKAVLPCQPKPNTTHLCMRPGSHGNVRTSSMFLFQEAGQSPSRRLAQHQPPCLGNWKETDLGQMDMPKLTAPVLGLVLQPCAPLPAHHGHLLPWLQFRACPPCHRAVAWL